MAQSLLLSLCLAWAGRAQAQDLAAAAEAIFSAAPFSRAAVSVLFVSLDDGATAYARQPDAAMIPASTAKLAVSGAVLEYLKPDFRYRTTFLARKDDPGRGQLSVLVWRGTGDPTLSGRNHSSPYEVFGIWGGSLAALGVSKVKRLVLDERYFEGPVTIPSWPEEELSYWYEAQISAIAFNDDCVDLTFVPGRQPGQRPGIILKPDFGYMKVKNRAVTGAPGSAFTLDYRRAPGANKVEFFGSIPAGGGERSDHVSVHQPARFAAHTLQSIWKAQGLKVSKLQDWDDAGLREEELAPLLVWESEPLSAILSVVNKNSQNLYAEQLLKTLGREVEGRGSSEAGLSVVSRFLRAAGLADSEFHLADGSGMSGADRMSAAGLVKILRYMHASPWASVYYDSLGIPGVDRAVRKRMNGDPAAAGMRLKTGTVSLGRNLAGYLRSRSGRLYAFAVLINGEKLDRGAVDAATDKLCLAAVHRLP
ncbi:MAG: D-alanyl-D-alanine carboxypeptidase/D-alanyl-D-alanine-endopeptidase [Elusimicrobiota bacterium]|jgi:D-alanyl-D-alanine carboxypeptidase/D-alanyl-D-alanine-endopeptidase (penicillin-binding protein 4)